MSERYGLGMTREEYLDGKHLVLEQDGNWDYWADEDEHNFFYVPHVGSTAAAGWFGDARHFLRWLSNERMKGRVHEPELCKMRLKFTGHRYYDEREVA